MRYYEPVGWHFAGVNFQVPGSFFHENHGSISGRLEIRGMHHTYRPYLPPFCSADYADEVLVELEIMQFYTLVNEYDYGKSPFFMGKLWKTDHKWSICNGEM